MFDTPILYLIFNRLDLTKITFPSICNIKPKKLFIAADGPRFGNQYDENNCILVREYVLSSIDWDCEVNVLFRESNLGCGKAVSSAITWFFSNVEEGIILEDDCMPDKSFFYYCSDLLHKYRYNEKIMHIGSNNFQNGIKRGNSDYYFSSIPHIWGWASWNRAWKKYDFELKKYNPENFIEILEKVYVHQCLIDYWVNIFNLTSRYEIDTWDYQWHFAILKFQGIAISPNINLVSNKGFSIDSTHTKVFDPLVSDLKRSSIIEIKHPPKIIISTKADLYTYINIYKIKCLKKWYQKLHIKHRFIKIAKMIKQIFSNYFVLNINQNI